MTTVSEEIKLEEEIQKNIKEIPDLKLRLRAVALNGFLLQKKKFDQELEKEIRILNQKFEMMALPLYEKAAEIVGGRAPKDEELVGLDKYLSAEEIAKKAENLIENDPVSDYWLKVFKHNEILSIFLSNI
jgi:hypothetical protein